MTDPHRAAVELAAAGQGGDQGRLAGPVRADQADVLAALQPQLRVLEQDAFADLQLRVLHLQHDAPGALRRGEGERERLLVAPVVRAPRPLGLEPIDLLHLGLRLARLRRLRPEALDEALHPLDLGLALLDVAAGRQLARGLLGAPGVPGTVEVAAAGGLDLEHAGADRFEEPAIVGDEDDGRVEFLQVALEPLQRLDVQVVGRLVEQEQLRLGGQHSRERGPGQLSAGERAQLPPELGVAEAEAVQRRLGLVAPAIAAGQLEPRLGRGVGVERRLAGRARHPRLEALQLGLDLQDPGQAGEDVLAQRQLPLARRTLVVQRNPDALAETERARVDPLLRGEDPQQGRLAGAVTAGERHPLARPEPERDVVEQLPCAYVLRQARGRDRRHDVSRFVRRSRKARRGSVMSPAEALGPAGRTRRVRARYTAACSGASSFTWKEEPQPQAATTFGLLTVKPAPWRPST